MLKTFLDLFVENNLTTWEDHFADPRTKNAMSLEGIKVRDGNTNRLAEILLKDFACSIATWLKGYDIESIEVNGWERGRSYSMPDVDFLIKLEDGNSFVLNSRIKFVDGGFSQSFEVVEGRA